MNIEFILHMERSFFISLFTYLLIYWSNNRRKGLIFVFYELFNFISSLSKYPFIYFLFNFQVRPVTLRRPAHRIPLLFRKLVNWHYHQRLSIKLLFEPIQCKVISQINHILIDLQVRGWWRRLLTVQCQDFLVYLQVRQILLIDTTPSLLPLHRVLTVIIDSIV